MTARNGSGAEADDASASTSRPGLPAKRMLGRRIVVLLGADHAELSILSRTLQALGVDMLEGDAADIWAGDGDEWRRPWISGLHDQLLSAIDRPMDRPEHALPFPAGWWRRPNVHKLRREMSKALAEALEGHEEPWGFADERTARLLPVWQDVFDELGLQPDYVWAIGRPKRKGKGRQSTARREADIAEVAWFTGNADVFKYVGDRIATVVDEDEWKGDPQGLMERLVERLQLRWRGSRFDLHETVSALLNAHEDRMAASRPLPVLPLALSFYDAIRRLEEDEDARGKVAAMVQSAELLRPLISPFLKSQDAAAHPGADAEINSLRREIDALRQSCAELRRTAEQAQTASPDGAEDDARLSALEQELEARVAETRWLHDQYRERLSEAEGEIDALRQSLATAEAAGAGFAHFAEPARGSEEELAQAHAEIQRLQAEMVNLNNANERYLARIYELKRALEDQVDLTGRPG